MTRQPRPAPDALTAGFWQAARRHELVVQQCSGCAELRHYPQSLCPHCHADRWHWTQVAGTGVIHSYTETHQAFHPAWRDRVPYVVATIALDCGVRMISDLAEPAAAVRIGAPVEVFFHDVDEDLTLPRFRLVTQERTP